LKGKEKKSLDMAAWLLLIVGGLNWGLVGLGSLANSGSWNVVEIVLGSVPVARDLVYLLVGLSALYLAWMELSK